MMRSSVQKPPDHSVPTVIALGGTGVIGTALRQIAAERGLAVLSLSLDPDASRPGWTNLSFDFESAAQGALTRFLAQAVPEDSPIKTVFSIAGLSPRGISEVARFAATRGAAMAHVSSCLVYRTDGLAEVDESAPVRTDGTAEFPYIRLKLAEEAALAAQDGLGWRLLRTNHILGRGSLLGCIPEHNRDPDLLRVLRAGGPLRLARAGRVPVSFIHAADLAAAMLDLCDDPATAGQALNVVHPVPVMADDYIRTIAALLGLPPPPIHGLEPEPEGFWALTARGTRYRSRHPSVVRLGFRHDLDSALRDTLAVGDAEYARLGTHLRDRLHGR